MTANSNSIVVRMPNWIGDCVMALPCLFALADKGYAIQLLGKPWLGDLFANYWPVVDITLPISKQQSQLHPNSLCFLLPNSFSSAKQTKQLGLKTVGYRGDWRRFLLHKSIPKPKRPIHESDYFLQLTNIFNQIAPNKLNHEQLFKDHLQQQLSKHKSLLLKEYPILDQPYLLICPFAIGTNKQGQNKQWPHWETWIKQIKQQRPELAIVCCPNKGEALAISDDALQHVTMLPNLNLIDYYVVMQYAQMVIGNDTGPMHMAALVNDKSLTLFGVTNPKRTCPIGSECIGTLDQWPTIAEVNHHIQ